MYNKRKFKAAENLDRREVVTNIIAEYITQKASVCPDMDILEAGCGRKWRFNLKDVQYTLTGVDVDKNALDIRMNEKCDLDIAILADLRTVSLEESSYDVIYSQYVLEHINGAENVLANFVRWLKPGGIMILVFPNRDSAYAFLTRVTPFWVHVLYKKYVQGIKNAGKPGYDPYPVFFDRVVSRNGIYEFCEKYGVVMKAEYKMDGRPVKNQIVWFLMRVLMWGLCLISFNRLSFNYRNLLYVIEKPR